MLFNSFEFLLLFLPVALLGYFVLGRAGTVYGAGWLAACSLFFYGWWDHRYLLLLCGSITFNYVAGLRIARHARTPAGWMLLAMTVFANLALLGYYKYAGFFVEATRLVAHHDWPVLSIVLPLGISFFTFTQIAFLVDAYRGVASEYRFAHYLLFVTYFPHLIAGPILHHKEMMPQFDDRRNYRPSMRNFEVGCTIFVIGLAKKVILADNIAPYANSLFTSGESPTFLVAWGGVLAYTFQLYFDFSGYCDMAIGLSRLFGVKLPLNFHSPYKATSIVDFWRRWHMTLSRFLRDYLYIALGGNRKGATRRYINLFATMVLGGLWHGAGWTFIIWGALHGTYLIINHAWSHLTHGRQGGAAGRFAAWLLTFLSVVVAWVFFRAESVDSALRILAGMAGLNGFALPYGVAARLGLGEAELARFGWQISLGGGQAMVMGYAQIVVCAAVAFLCPNTQQIARLHEPALPEREPLGEAPALLTWQPRAGWAVVLGLVAAVGLMSLGRPSEFLYFQF